MKHGHILVRYPGGKGLLRRWLLGLFPEEHRHYVEPFAGAASVLLAKPPSARETLIESDADQANLLAVIRDYPTALREELSGVPHDCEVWREARSRLLAGQYADPIEQAALAFIWRNQSRNGEGFVWRVNRDRDDQAQFLACVRKIDASSDRLRGVEIIHGDGLDYLDAFDDPATLVYLDPPYPLETRSGRRYYRDQDWLSEDHARLLSRIRTLKSKVLVSTYKNLTYELFLSGWRRAEKIVFAHSHMNSIGSNKVLRTEVAFMNY